MAGFGRRREPVDTYQDGTHDETRAMRLDDGYARDRFGGVNPGAAFFGWIVAVGMTVLLTGLLAAVVAVIGYSGPQPPTPAEVQAPGDLAGAGLVAAAVLLAVLLVAYYCGGYVAGRMSRFDGGRQGLLVWVISLLATLAAGALAAVAGEEYGLVDRTRLPRPGVDVGLGSELATAGIVAGVVVLVVTLAAAVAGGKVGRRYHRRVDRAAERIV